MTQQQALKLFEEKKVRTVWDTDTEKWYFSIVDIVAVLTESTDPKQYIKRLRNRDPELQVKWGTICTPVRMRATDGKLRLVDAADTQGVLRIIQSIPSPKAEPFKQWMALTWPRFASLRGTKQSRGVGFLDCCASLAMTVTMTVAVIARNEAIQKRA